MLKYKFWARKTDRGRHFLHKDAGRAFLSVPGFVRRIILSWLSAVTAEYIMLPGELRDLALLNGLANMSPARVVGITGTIFFFLTGLSCSLNTRIFERWGMAAAGAVLIVSALRASGGQGFLMICAGVLAVLILFAVYGWDGSREPAAEPGHRGKLHEFALAPKRTRRVYLWLSAGLSAAFFLFVSAWTVGRVYCFSSPTYDFGIFSQMFYYMKESGLPMTTLERDGLLSHFAVHVSPIYYLMLPFYRLAPVPAALQVLQAAVMTSAVIPLWEIGKRRSLTGGQRVMLCAVLFLYPAYSGGAGYDLHENCFLTPLILWMFCGIESGRSALTIGAAVLVWMVKEDAAVYVAAAALWLIVRTVLRPGKPDWRNLAVGTALLAASLGWFFLATGYLARYGDGVMTYRYGNFLYDGSSSLAAVVRSVFLNPMKAVYECADTEKLRFIAMTLLPLLGLPLLTRRYERYILLIPYILVNLMSDYRYQHDIFFQYMFGSGASLIYLTVLNLSDLRNGRRRFLVLAAAVLVSAAGFGGAVVPKAARYPVQAVRYYEYYQNIRDTLDTIPEHAPAAASTFYTAYLSRRETLYDIRYCSAEHLLSAEYIVLDLSSDSDYQKYASGGRDNGLDNLTELLEANGYEEYERLDSVLAIYRRGRPETLLR